jgi:hypothetical protein
MRCSLFQSSNRQARPSGRLEGSIGACEHDKVPTLVYASNIRYQTYSVRNIASRIPRATRIKCQGNCGNFTGYL